MHLAASIEEPKILLRPCCYNAPALDSPTGARRLRSRLVGWTAKGGAEGLLCAAGPDGVGVALKVEDGSGRGVRPVLGSFLARLGLDREALERAGLGRLPLLNSRDEECGEVVTEA